MQERDASRWCWEGRRGQGLRTGDSRAMERGGGPGRLLSGQRCGLSLGSLTLGRLSSNPMSQLEMVPGGGSRLCSEEASALDGFLQDPVLYGP